MLRNKLITGSAVLLAAMFAALATPAWSQEIYKASPEVEAEQLAILRSEAPPADKAIACKRLAIDGSSAAVPDLAVLLFDPQLASWSRIALQAIPGSAPDEALRTASDSLQGKLLVGVINSIGVRRDSGAVERLIARLTDSDPEVAAAAAVALGRIATPAAVKALRNSLAVEPVAVRSAVAEGCVLCAEQLRSIDYSAEAAALYDQVRRAEVPKQRLLEATRGAILARGEDGIPLLLEQLQSQDKALFQLALSTAREIPGNEIDKTLAEELARATPDRAALIVQAMADRPETVLLEAVLKAATEGPDMVRIAAIGALGRVGNETCLASLLATALEANQELAKAAKATLAALPGQNVDAQIVELIPSAEGTKYPLLIELLGERRIDSMPHLLKALEHADKIVRAAALTSLGKTVRPDGLAVLIAQTVSPNHAEDQEAAQEALKAASIRMPDREACAAELAAALEKATSVPTKGAVLQILGAVAGTKALETLGAAAKGTEAELQDISSRLLGEWMTEDAAPVLLDLAKTAPEGRIKVRALRGYIRIARQFVLPDTQRAEMCQKALEAAEQPGEKKLVLEVLKRYPSVETLSLAIQTMADPDLSDEATAATLAIAEKLVKDGTDVKELLSQANFGNLKLEIVKGEYGADSTMKDVTEVLQTKVTGSPVIALPDDYNTTFGEDPAPGTSKTLKIQYVMNGKSGEASFAENAFIILPMPK